MLKIIAWDDMVEGTRGIPCSNIQTALYYVEHEGNIEVDDYVEYSQDVMFQPPWWVVFEPEGN